MFEERDIDRIEKITVVTLIIVTCLLFWIIIISSLVHHFHVKPM
jgi:hypothetical protein